jgi:hypothetical protein
MAFHSRIRVAPKLVSAIAARRQKQLHAPEAAARQSTSNISERSVFARRCSTGLALDVARRRLLLVATRVGTRRATPSSQDTVRLHSAPGTQPWICVLVDTKPQRPYRTSVNSPRLLSADHMVQSDRCPSSWSELHIDVFWNARRICSETHICG